MTSTNSSLRPAWQSRGNQGGGRGFQPPPQVATERANSNSNAATNSTSSSNNNGNSGTKKHNNNNNNNSSNDPTSSNHHHHTNRHEHYTNDSGGDNNRRERQTSSNFNKFSALDDDDEIVATAEAGSGNTGSSSNKSNANTSSNNNNNAKVPRSEALRVSSGSAASSISTVARNISSGRPTRSLAELVASTPGPERERGSSFGAAAAASATASGTGVASATHSRYGISGRSNSIDHTSTTAGAVSSSVEVVKVTKYTRERLMALRPNPISEPSEILVDSVSPDVRNVILSDVPQDPVCWDDFDAEEIWATAGPSIRRSVSTGPSGGPGGKIPLGGSSSMERSTGTGIPAEDAAATSARRVSSTSSGLPRAPSRGISSTASGSGGGDFGRWQRGVALPPPDTNSNRKSSTGGTGRNDREADDPSELWDDPGSGMDGTGAAADFSAFGVSIPAAKFESTGTSTDTFDFEKMTEATKRFEEELHGTSKAPTIKDVADAGEDNGDDDDDTTNEVRGIRVDPKRPLATDGTTIRSGSGNDVNVFEDFDDPLLAVTATAIDGEDNGSGDGILATAAFTDGVESENENDMVDTKHVKQPSIPVTVKSIDEDPDASSRLMALIGVKKDDPVIQNPDPIISSLIAQSAAVASSNDPASSSFMEPPKLSTSAWGIPEPIINTKAAPLMGLSSNPWGGSLLSPEIDQMHGLDLQARLRAADLEQQQKAREEETRRRQEKEEAQRRAIAQQQAEQQERVRMQQYQQQQQQQQQQAASVGVQSQVENVLMERISAILENSWGRSDLVSILSTLHTEDTRVIPLLSTVDALRALLLRNSQRVAVRHDTSLRAEMASLLITNAQWQQRQQQTAVAAQQQQRLRAQQEELKRREHQRRLEEQQRAIAAAAMAQQQQVVPVVPDAPWYYSDPQKNIQGPFRGEEMRQWLEAGYFKGDLPISQQASGPFRPLSAIFPDTSVAFVAPSIPKNVVTTANEEAKARALAEERARKEAAERQSMAEQAAAAERLENERRTKEVERRAREAAAERQRMLAERERRAKEADPSESSAGGNGGGGNESSAQLKMMLGLNSQFGAAQVDAQPAKKLEQVDPILTGTSATTAAVVMSATNAPKVQASQVPAASIEKKATKSTNKATTTIDPTQSTSVPTPAVVTQPAPAWGGAAATKVATRKSMSEIQREEARAAAAAMRDESAMPSSSGWANVAAARGKSNVWAGGAATQKPAVVLTKSAGAVSLTPAARPIATQGRTASMGSGTQAQPNAQRASGGGNTTSNTSTSAPNADAFGAKMSPQLEKWCKDQMQKLNGTDDLTLASFCMTLSDPVEIRQYLTTYLGASPQVNSFATEFINRTKPAAKEKIDEWESTVTVKKGKKKKPATK